ncbi:uncharacterized protein LOC135390934 [Ornithodoros turicata]
MTVRQVACNMQKTTVWLLVHLGVSWFVSSVYGMYGDNTASASVYYFENYCTNSTTDVPILLDTMGTIILNQSEKRFNCSVEVQFDGQSGLLITLVNITLKESPNCTEEYFEVTTLGQDPKAFGPKFCKTQSDVLESNPEMQVVIEPLETDGAVNLTLSSAANATGPLPAFVLALTIFTAVNPKTQQCASRFEHQCPTNRCIPMGIFCDGHNHCGGSQRPVPLECPGGPTQKETVWAIATIAFGLVSMALLLPAFVWTAVRGGQIQVTSVIHNGKPSVSPSDPSINDPERGSAPTEAPWVQGTSTQDPVPETTNDTAHLVHS